MGTKLVVHWEATPDCIRVMADIPKRRNGDHNEAALGRVLLALSEVNPDAFDPHEPPQREPAPPVIPHSVAAAFQRDLTPAEDDEGEAIPGFRCANGACIGD